jgi:hypothetical protein
MISSGKQPARLGFWAVVLIGVFAWAPATYPGYWQSLEGFIPAFNVTQNSSIAKVATAADLWRGAGSATFILAQPFLLLGFTPVEAVRIVFILALILGGLGIYAWLRPTYGDRGAGLAGITYMFLPTVLSTVYIRGSLSDALILALLPLTLASTAAYASRDADDTRRSPAVAGLMLIGILWMWRTQAGLAIFATLLLVVYALVVERDRLAALVTTVSGIIGFVSLIPLWSIQSPAPVDFNQHFLYLFQLFGNQWAVAPSIPGWQDRYPFQLGFIAVAFAVVALWLWFRTRHSLKVDSHVTRLLAFSFIGSLVLILLSLNISNPLWQLTGADRFLVYPWQILLIAAPLLAAIAGSLPVLNASFSQAPYWVVLVTLIVLGSYSYLTTEFTEIVSGPTPYSIVGPEQNIAILDADLVESEDRSSAELTVIWQALQPLPADYNIFFQALSENGENSQVVAQLDTQPLGGERPVTDWRQGEILVETYQLDLSQLDASQADNPLSYYFGYYDWSNGERLPVDGGIDDKLVFHGR